MSDAALTIFGGAAGAAIVAGIFNLLKFLLERRAKKKDRTMDKKDALTVEVDCLKDGLRMLLYDRIKALAKEYIARGWITTEEMEDLISMHGVYHNQLSGNGFLDSLMAQVMGMQIKN